MAHIQLSITAERSREFLGIVGLLTFHFESARAITIGISSAGWLVVDAPLRGE
jgi:hypothetical protein